MKRCCKVTRTLITSMLLLASKEGSKIFLLLIVALATDAAFLSMNPVEMLGDICAQDSQSKRFKTCIHWGVWRWVSGCGGGINGGVGIGADLARAFGYLLLQGEREFPHSDEPHIPLRGVSNQSVVSA